MNIEDINKAIQGEEGQELREAVLNLALETDEAKKRIQNAQITYFEDNQGQVRKEVLDRFDADFEKHGIEKKGKTYETLEGVLADYSDLRESSADQISKAEFDKLKQQNEDLIKNGSESLQQELQASRNANKALDEQWANKFNGLKSSIEESANNEWAKKGLKGLEFTVPDDVSNDLIEAKMAKLKSRVENKDGERRFLDSEGKPLRDHLSNPITPEAYWQNELKSIIKSKQVRQKAEQDTVVKTEQGVSVTLDRSKFSTRREFSYHIHEVLLSQGIVRNSSEWTKAKNAAYHSYKVGDLPHS